MSKMKSLNPEPVASDAFDRPPSENDWQAFADALEAGNSPAVRRFLADRQLPIALAPILTMIRPEAARLQAIADADVPQVEIDAATTKRDMLRQSHPRTADDAAKVGQALADLTNEIAAMEARHALAANAATELAGLQNVFSELFDGTPGKKACGGMFSPTIHNSLVENGFEPQRLARQPWREAFALQFDTSTTPRRRLRAVGGPAR